MTDKIEKKKNIIMRSVVSTFLKRAFLDLARLLYPRIKDSYHKPEDYCPEVQELYRIFGVVMSREKGRANKIKWQTIRDIICWICEYDRAYLLRLLDAFDIADKEKLKITASDESLKHLNYNFGGRPFNVCEDDIE